MRPYQVHRMTGVILRNALHRAKPIMQSYENPHNITYSFNLDKVLWNGLRDLRRHFAAVEQKEALSEVIKVQSELWAMPRTSERIWKMIDYFHSTDNRLSDIAKNSAPKETLDETSSSISIDTIPIFYTRPINYWLVMSAKNEDFLHYKTRPRLSHDEEVDLIKQAQSGNQEAKQILIEANLFFIFKEVSRWIHYRIPAADLVQEGVLGLLRGIATHDGKGNFLTFAGIQVKQAIDDIVKKEGRMLFGSGLSKKIIELNHWVDLLSMGLGRMPNLAEVARYMYPIDIEQIAKTLSRLYKSIVPPDDPRTIRAIERREKNRVHNVETIIRSARSKIFALDKQLPDEDPDWSTISRISERLKPTTQADIIPDKRTTKMERLDQIDWEILRKKIQQELGPRRPVQGRCMDLRYFNLPDGKVQKFAEIGAMFNQGKFAPFEAHKRAIKNLKQSSLLTLFEDFYFVK